MGDPVVIYPGVPCDRCEFCVGGEESMCVSLCVIGEQRAGTFAEYVSVPEKCLFPKPEALSFDEAAALPLVFLTAWRMLITKARIKPGDSVLIVGIGGGVSGAALQIAKRVGCRVFVTSGSDEKLERARKLGADELINHCAKDFSAEIRRITGKRGVDVVVDSVGGDSFQKSVLSLAKGGKLVTCGATSGQSPLLEIPRVFWNHLSILGSTLGSRKEFLEVLKAVQENSLHPIIDSIYPLEEVRAAQLRMESQAQFGKIILTP
jgi:NADPH:quinone reductase-like Zn-dependent oxidoreductase